MFRERTEAGYLEITEQVDHHKGYSYKIYIDIQSLGVCCEKTVSFDVTKERRASELFKKLANTFSCRIRKEYLYIYMPLEYEEKDAKTLDVGWRNITRGIFAHYNFYRSTNTAHISFEKITTRDDLDAVIRGFFFCTLDEIEHYSEKVEEK